jgi:hypothetical protein
VQPDPRHLDRRRGRHPGHPGHRRVARAGRHRAAGRRLGTRVKDADPITCPTVRLKTANATRIGGQILTDKINPPKAGTILVRRPIVDQLTGNMVMPWEIEPGYLCRVRETGDARSPAP